MCLIVPDRPAFGPSNTFTTSPTCICDSRQTQWFVSCSEAKTRSQTRCRRGKIQTSIRMLKHDHHSLAPTVF